jgi:hypothetical protein
MKIYTSFEEIDKDIRVLKLEKEISKEEIKLSYNNIKEDFSFLNVVGKTAGTIIQKALAFKIIKKIIR